MPRIVGRNAIGAGEVLDEAARVDRQVQQARRERRQEKQRVQIGCGRGRARAWRPVGVLDDRQPR